MCFLPVRVSVRKRHRSGNDLAPGISGTLAGQTRWSTEVSSLQGQPVERLNERRTDRHKACGYFGKVCSYWKVAFGKPLCIWKGVLFFRLCDKSLCLCRWIEKNTLLGLLLLVGEVVRERYDQIRHTLSRPVSNPKIISYPVNKLEKIVKE